MRDTITNPYRYANSDLNAASNAHGDRNVHSQSNAYGFTDTDTVYVLRHAYIHANAVYAYSHSISHSNTDGNGDADSYGNFNGYTHTHPNAQSDAHPEGSPYTEVSSHSAAAPIGNCGRDAALRRPNRAARCPYQFDQLEVLPIGRSPASARLMRCRPSANTSVFTPIPMRK